MPFLYFDLGNVLLHFDHRLAARQMAEVAGISADEAWRIVFAGGLELEYERGALDCRAFHEEFCRQSNSRPDFAQLKQAAAAIFTPNHAVIDLVGELHAAGHRLGVLSNTCAAHWEYCTDGRYGFLNECFDVYALSYELKSMKPEPEIYHRAANLADVAPTEIFFVDDRHENVLAAREAGYDAVLYESQEGLRDQLLRRELI
jgi:HAD superfamily hydrolase (TIGR01509 family)